MLAKRRTEVVGVSDAADMSSSADSTETSDTSSATESTDMASAEPAHVGSAAEAAPVSTTAASAAGIRRNREQAGGQQGCCQDRNHSFHVIAPFFGKSARNYERNRADMLMFERWERRRVLPLNSLLRLAASVPKGVADVSATRSDARKTEPDVADPVHLSLDPSRLARSERQKPVFGSHGGFVHGSEANAPTSGARTQVSGVTLA
jgi:hypothetical protein